MKSAVILRRRLFQAYRRPLFAGAIFVCLLTLCATAGCESGSSAKPVDGSPGAVGDGNPSGGSVANADKRTADQILKDMEKTYRNSKSYADEAKLHIHFDRDGNVFDKDVDFSASFVRPNKIRLYCYDARIISDGKTFSAAVLSIPNVVMQVPAPEVLTMADVLRDPQLNKTLTEGGPAGQIQLPFLIADDTLKDVLKDAMQPPKLGAPQRIDGKLCNRVIIDEADGQMTLWIDQQQNILRRIELPTGDFKKVLDQGGVTKDLSTVVNFDNAKINEPVDDKAFQFEIPPNTQVLQQIVELVPPTPVAPASEPTNLKLTKLWTAADLKIPGNILVVDSPNSAPKILVLEGWNSVAELDANGKLVAMHDLKLSQDQPVVRLRTGAGADGKRYFAGLADGMPQFHLFDDAWNRVLSYPKPEERATAGVCDVQLVDLDGKGQLEMGVGYWGDVGVQGVSLTGDKLWRDGSLQFVLHMAATSPDAQGHRKLLCMNNRGSIVPLNFEGKAEPEIVVQNRLLENIFSADMQGKGQFDYCAFSTNNNQENFALGVSLDGKELWNYQLPNGVAGLPIEAATTGDLAGNGAKQWIIPGADGSVHILAADGKPIDKFNTGSALAGIGAMKIGNRHVLLVSKVLDKPEGETKHVLEAWEVEPAGK